jgi:flagellar biosynthetic protein FliR
MCMPWRVTGRRMLQQLLTANLFAFFLVFARIGSAALLLPGIGEGYVSPRLRLVFALAFSLALMPALSPNLPPAPAGAIALALLLGGEIVIGLFLGTLVRILLLALETAGMVIALQIGFASALAQDPTTAQQGSVISNFLIALAVVLIFATGLHQPMIRAVADSYTLFPAGGPPPGGDMALAVMRTVADAFALAVEFAAPFILLGLLFNLALGLLSRLMPQLQVFFVGLPVQILAGFVLLIAALGLAMTWFMSRFSDALPGLL